MKSLKGIAKDADYTLTMFKKMCWDLKKYAEVKGFGFRINKGYGTMLRNISTMMFSDCCSLKTVKLYNGITKLNYGMFSG